MSKYQLYSYDLICDGEKGNYSVNDIYRTGIVVEIPENITDKKLVKLLKREGIIKKNIRHSSIIIEGDSDYTLYFTYSTQKRFSPEFELRKED